MKKLLFAVFCCLLGSSAFAQGGGLTIDNTANPCGVYIVMIAREPSNSAGMCRITANQFYVAAGTTSPAAWSSSVWNFETSVGWMTHPGTAVLPATTDFEWTGVNFQFDCPAAVIGAGCSNGGGGMVSGIAGSGFCFAFPVATTWTSVPWGCRNASWATVPTPGPMVDAVLTFW